MLTINSGLKSLSLLKRNQTASASVFNQPIDITSYKKGVCLLEYEYGGVIEREKVIVQ